MRTTWPHSVDLPFLSVCQTGVEKRAAATVVVEGGSGNGGGRRQWRWFGGCDEGLAIVMEVAEAATIVIAKMKFDLKKDFKILKKKLKIFMNAKIDFSAGTEWTGTSSSLALPVSLMVSVITFFFFEKQSCCCCCCCCCCCFVVVLLFLFCCIGCCCFFCCCCCCCCCCHRRCCRRCCSLCGLLIK